ncbi:MAG: hypothetical protein HOO96_25485 [Polyangiaceae bacterium]|nr:hypothetical protein [Polyangiaceae bacterium]
MSARRPTSDAPVDDKRSSSPSAKMRVRAPLTLERQAFPCGSIVPPAPGVPDEMDRVKLIAELTRILRDPNVPEGTRRAGLTLVGWLARRMPGEAAHALGCEDEAEVTHVRQKQR